MTITDAAAPDQIVVESLLAADEQTFLGLVDIHHQAMVRLAATFVATADGAETLVNDTWSVIIDSLGCWGHSSSSSLKTWMFTLLVDQARSAVGCIDDHPTDRNQTNAEEPAVDPSRFRGAGDSWAGHWIDPPELVEVNAGGEARLRLVLDAAIGDLPPSQQRVIWLRDVEGWPSTDVSEVLALDEAHQSRLLVRGRARLCGALQRELASGRGQSPQRMAPAA